MLVLQFLNVGLNYLSYKPSVGPFSSQSYEKQIKYPDKILNFGSRLAWRPGITKLSFVVTSCPGIFFIFNRTLSNIRNSKYLLLNKKSCGVFLRQKYCCPIIILKPEMVIGKWVEWSVWLSINCNQWLMTPVELVLWFLPLFLPPILFFGNKIEVTFDSKLLVTSPRI